MPSYTGQYTRTVVGNDEVWVLKSSGTFTVEALITVEALVVGGGGAGGSGDGGGGGAGGISYASSRGIGAGSHAVVVGAGGVRGNVAPNTVSTNGGASSFNGMIGNGGGAGQSWASGVPQDGGSGGGGRSGSAMLYGKTTGNVGPQVFGNNGGHGNYPNSDSNYHQGGGGGAGAAGSIGNGGAGRAFSITGTSTYYGGGGGGSNASNGHTDWHPGGSGGGGRGASSGAGNVAVAGTNNLGGGGGGGVGEGDTQGANRLGANGGSGVVILRFSQIRKVTVTAGTGLSSNKTGINWVINGSAFSVTFTADNSYIIDTILINGSAFNVTNRRTQTVSIASVTSDITIAATARRSTVSAGSLLAQQGTQ